MRLWRCWSEGADRSHRSEESALRWGVGTVHTVFPDGSKPEMTSPGLYML